MTPEADGIEKVVAAFFAAFSNANGSAPVDTLYEICLPKAVIVNVTNTEPAIYSLEQFIEPRRTLLSSGSLIDFREYEVSAETAVHGPIAQRTSRYEKSWTENGVSKHGAGTKVFSFVLTPRGWKIASVLWHDRPDP